MENLKAYNETFTRFSTHSGNTQILIYRRKKSRSFSTIINHLLANNGYYLKQKTLGLAALTIAILCPLLLQDITVSVFMFPLGLYMMVTKEKVMTV